MTKLRLKKVMRYDDRGRVLRLFRVMWESGPMPIGHKLSFALQPKIFEWHRELWDWRVVLFGLRIHHVKGAGRYV